jgi:hypothetical protein
LKTAPNRNYQVLYAIGILVIFVAMAFYTRELEQRKQRQKLGEATLGQVDTGSFMLKLALLGGARGVAANVLWLRADDLKKAHEWDRLKATVDLITKLQPHFLSVWTFQGWNLAYNVSVEWDAPEDKYEWIKQGIEFLKDGVRKNETSPDLMWDTAWTYYHKIGFADEAVILRRLFYDDDDEPFKTYVDARTGIAHTKDDNFLLGYGWFTNAVEKVDQGNARLATEFSKSVDYVDKPTQHKGRPGDLHFRTMPAHAQTRYASSLEKESIMGVPAKFGEVASIEWGKALQEWNQFGQYSWPAFSDPDQMVRIDDSTNMAAFAKLTDVQKYWTERWANDTNYRYWKDRAAAEMEKDGVTARQFFYEGTKALKAGRFVSETDKNGNLRRGAIENYAEGLKLWERLLSRHPEYLNDQLNMKDTGQIVKRYAYALRQAGQDLPKDTPFLDKYEQVKDDTSVDPFDALEVIRSTPTAPASGDRR